LREGEVARTSPRLPPSGFSSPPRMVGSSIKRTRRAGRKGGFLQHRKTSSPLT